MASCSKLAGIGARVLAFALSCALLIAAAMFSLVIFSLVAAVVLLALAFGGWRYKASRRPTSRVRDRNQIIDIEDREVQQRER